MNVLRTINPIPQNYLKQISAISEIYEVQIFRNYNFTEWLRNVLWKWKDNSGDSIRNYLKSSSSNWLKITWKRNTSMLSKCFRTNFWLHRKGGNQKMEVTTINFTRRYSSPNLKEIAALIGDDIHIYNLCCHHIRNQVFINFSNLQPNSRGKF